jgi:phosphoribosylanthranilate isomerase
MATRIKFCGITRLDDAQAAVEAGAWALGVILWPGSPRRGRLDVAAEIVAAYRRRVEIAGVFVDAPLDTVIAAVEVAGFSMVQLHGSEGPAYCGEVARRTGTKVIKATRVRGREDLQAMRAFHTDYWMLDAHGGGSTFDWSLAASARGGPPVILAGGLTPENVGDAIAQVRPFAVDVASGVESEPGVKDHEKLRAFAEAVARQGPTEPAA